MKPLSRWNLLSPWLLQNLIWIPTRLLLMIFGRIEIHGKENLKKFKGNAIFACNHTCEMDVFLVPGTLAMMSRFSPMTYTSREQAFYTRAKWRQRFYGGLFFRSWGGFPVKTGLHDYAASLAVHERILKAGGSVCIFPEGRTTRDGAIQEGKGGVAYLAYATGRPIIPVRMSGLFRITPLEFFTFRRKLSISYGEPIYVTAQAGVTPTIDELKASANKVMDAIRALPGVAPQVERAPVPVTV